MLFFFITTIHNYYYLLETIFSEEVGLGKEKGFDLYKAVYFTRSEGAVCFSLRYCYYIIRTMMIDFLVG